VGEPFASIVIQSGERSDEAFVAKIERLIQSIQQMAGNELHITLSLGEQTPETYRRWMNAARIAICCALRFPISSYTANCIRRTLFIPILPGWKRWSLCARSDIR